MNEQPRPRLTTYGVALLATAVTVVVRWLLWPALDDAVPHLAFFPAVMIAAYYGGFGPGLLATLLGAFVANVVFTEPHFSLEYKGAHTAVALPLFVLGGVVISALSESLHRTRQRLVADERRRVAETLHETEERFRQLAENIHEIFWMMDPQHNRLVYVSPSYEEVWGRTAQSLYDQPRSWIESIHPDDRAEVVKRIEQYRRGVFPDGEFRVVRPDGSIRWVRNRAFPINDPTGHIARIAGLAVDITERKQAEEALAQERFLLHALLDNIPDKIYFKDAASRFVRINTSLATYFGLSDPAQAIGKTDSNFFAEEHSQPTYADEQEIIRTGQPLVGKEERGVRLDRPERWVSTTKMPFRDKDGTIIGTFGVSRDITQLKQAEEEAPAASEHRWRSLTEALPQLVWSATPDGSCDYFSTQWTQHTGIPTRDLLGWRWLETLHPDDREPTRRFWLDSVAGRHPYDVEYRVRRWDGVYRWFKTRGVPIRDEAGRIVNWFGTCTDITDLRQTEEALRQSEERFRGTFENAAVGIMHGDAHGRFLRVNQKYCEIVGFSREELLNMAIQDVTYPDDMVATLEKYIPLTRGELPSYTEEKRDIRKDGSVGWIHISVSLQRDASGAPLHTIGIIQDISVRKRLEEELRQAKDAAESANRAKDEFLANVSHEIRTPMNAILNLTELVLDTPLTDDQRQCLRTVKSAADNLLGIINDLLDFAKIEAGKMELDPANFSLRSAPGDTLRALATRAHQKGLELVCQIDEGVPDAIIGDAGRLRQVLLNLIGNAIKFTQTGEVVVRVEPTADSLSEEEVRVRFAVSDTGIGIPLQMQERIFRAFEQEDTSTTRKYGGTGLGLSIAARLVALMGGTITVDSALGHGSTFAFTARFGRQPHPAELTPTPALIRLHGLRVLVVDDNATNRRILDGWLRGWQMEPQAEGDGVAATCALWHAVTQGRPYPLVLLDVRMPDTDGLALAARIREWPALATTRIILLTSGDRPGDLSRARELRVDAHLLKPVQQEELLDTIYRVLQKDEPGRRKDEQERTAAPDSSFVPQTPAGGDPPPSFPLSILVAEDNEFNAQLMEQLLVRRGHRVQLAGDGRAALALAEKDGFDLLLLDVHMPEMDGFEVIRAIRERETTAGGHLPVIALTARSRKEDRERCLAAGMDDFLTKPVRMPDLFAAIDRVSRVNRPPEVVDPVLTPSTVLAACENDNALLQKLCGWFRDRVPEHLAALSAACSAGDLGRIQAAAHKLTGMVAVFSTPVGELASSVEDQATAGELVLASELATRLAAAGTALLRLTEGLNLERLHALAAQEPNRG